MILILNFQLIKRKFIYLQQKLLVGNEINKMYFRLYIGLCHYNKNISKIISLGLNVNTIQYIYIYFLYCYITIYFFLIINYFHKVITRLKNILLAKNKHINFTKYLIYEVFDNLRFIKNRQKRMEP